MLEMDLHDVEQSGKLAVGFWAHCHLARSYNYDQLRRIFESASVAIPRSSSLIIKFIQGRSSLGTKIGSTISETAHVLARTIGSVTFEYYLSAVAIQK